MIIVLADTRDQAMQYMARMLWVPGKDARYVREPDSLRGLHEPTVHVVMPAVSCLSRDMRVMLLTRNAEVTYVYDA